MKMKIYRNEKHMARLLLMCMDGKFTIQKEKTKMGNDDDMMTAEEFFGGIEPKRSNRIGACRTRRKKSAKTIFLEAKAKMIMRIYGVSRAKALEIAASREAKEFSVERHIGEEVIGDIATFIHGARGGTVGL